MTVVWLALLSSVACARILGIDPPEPRVLDLGGAAGEAAGGVGEMAAPIADAGDGAASTAASINIDGPDAVALCPGADAVVSLQASHGHLPYRWSLLDADPAFKLSASDSNGEQAVLSGSPRGPGPYPLKVQVADANQLKFQRTIEVSLRAAPLIKAPALASVCPNELYKAKFTAEGGNPSAYQWSTDLPASSGLSLVHDELQGKFLGATNGATHIDFTLRLQDGGSCAPRPVSVTLPIESPTSSACPAVGFANQLSGRPPPPPCLGNDYNEQLVPRRGRGPYQWAVTAPLGLSFDASTQRISGTISAAGTLTAQLTDDATGRTIEDSFPLQPRSKCWFAYVSTETGSSRLHLFDALLPDNRRSLPTSAASDPVRDFKFSPDGQFLAYRTGTSDDEASLSIVKLATWQEEQFDFTRVSHYEWSLDSSVLAVAYRATSGDVLSGVKVAQAISASPSASIVFPLFLPTATPVASEMVWLNDASLAFFSPVLVTLNPFFFPAVAGLADSGFGTPTLKVTSFYQASAQLRRAASGLFVVPSSGEIDFYGNDGSNPVSHDNVVISPSGRYAARATQHSLALFRAGNSSLEGSPPVDEKDGCDVVLAWAAGTERIACAHKTPNSDDELTVFDVDSQTDTLSPASAVSLALPYPDGAQVQRRRLFSATGARFAFSGSDTLSVVTFDGGPPKADYNLALAPSTTAPNNAFAELAFSPNEQLLLQHRGSQLSFFDLEDPSLGEVVLGEGPALAASVPCEEDFRNDSVGWCGASRPNEPFLWAPNSDLAAYQSAAGTLRIYDFTWYKHGLFMPIGVNEQCAAGCVAAGQFAFQP
jgi:hypothetical protein